MNYQDDSLRISEQFALLNKSYDFVVMLTPTTGHGSPVGSLTPASIIARYIDLDTGYLWWATGDTNTEWDNITGGGGGGFTPPGPVAEIDWKASGNTGVYSAIVDDYINEGQGAVGIYPAPLGEGDSNVAQLSLYDSNFNPAGGYYGDATDGYSLYLSPGYIWSGDWEGDDSAFELTTDGLHWYNLEDAAISSGGVLELESGSGGPIVLGSSGEIILTAGEFSWAIQNADGRFSFPAGQSLYTADELSDLADLGSAGDFALIVNEGNPFYAVNNQGTWEQYAAGGGGGAIVHSFAFDFNTADSTPVTAYTPADGELILAAYIYVTEAFNGTSPTAILGSDDAGGIVGSTDLTSVAPGQIEYEGGPPAWNGIAPSTGAPISLVVTQGGSTAGTGVVYIVSSLVSGDNGEQSFAFVNLNDGDHDAAANEITYLWDSGEASVYLPSEPPDGATNTIINGFSMSGNYYGQTTVMSLDGEARFYGISQRGIVDDATWIVVTQGESITLRYTASVRTWDVVIAAAPPQTTGYIEVHAIIAGASDLVVQAAPQYDSQQGPYLSPVGPNDMDWSPLLVIAESGQIQAVYEGEYVNPTLWDEMDFSGFLLVWDLTGTNLLEAQFDGSNGTSPGPLGLTEIQSIGSDLSISEDTLSIVSVAGGTYNVQLKLYSEWD